MAKSVLKYGFCML